MEPALSTKHKDISPINSSISNIADDGKPSISKSTRKSEPLLETLPNFSRFVHAQLVRPVSTKAPSSVKTSKMTSRAVCHLRSMLAAAVS
jgi:26S proteasome regulatory subunit N2